MAKKRLLFLVAKKTFFLASKTIFVVKKIVFLAKKKFFSRTLPEPVHRPKTLNNVDNFPNILYVTAALSWRPFLK